MKALTHEQRRLSLTPLRTGLGEEKLGSSIEQLNPMTGPERLRKVLEDRSLHDGPESPRPVLEDSTVAVSSKAEVGGRKKASKQGPMTWRPSKDSELGRTPVDRREKQLAAREDKLKAQLTELRDLGDGLLAALDRVPGGSYEVKEAYARIVDLMSAVDGSLTRLAHGKAP